MARLLPQSARAPTAAETRYRRLLEELRKSGQPQREFAAAKGIASATLSWWRSELRRRGRVRSGTGRNGTSAPRLVPVRISAESISDDVGFVVELRSRRVVTVKPGFDAAELKRLVEVLEAC